MRIAAGLHIRSEIVQLMQMLGIERDVGVMFSALDADGSGDIGFEEFFHWCAVKEEGDLPSQGERWLIC